MQRTTIFASWVRVQILGSLGAIVAHGLRRHLLNEMYSVWKLLPDKSD